MAQEADFVAGPLVDYQAKGHAVRLVGKTDVAGSPAYDIEITLANGEVQHEMIDAESYLAVREVSRHQQGDEEMEIETSLRDFKAVDGVMMPFTLVNRVVDAPADAPTETITVAAYQFGVAIDDGRFAFPAAAAPEPSTAPAKPPGR